MKAVIDMNKKNEHSFSSVLSIDPYIGEFYTSVSNRLSKAKKVQYSKEQYAISFLNTKNFIHTQLGLSKNIPQEDVYDAIYNKAYDELALDQAVEYHIQIIESFNNLDEENRYFHVFIVDPSEVEEIFKDVIDKIKYIDVIIPAPLLLKSLYTKEIIEVKGGTDCFVYLQENDAFLTLYSEGEFLYTKSIKFSISEMHERFCELKGEHIEYEAFKRFLSSVNLKYSEAEEKETLIKLYKELFATINDILTYAKRAFELDKIYTVYIGSSIYFESKLDEMLESEIAIKSRVFEFDYGFESDANYIDQLHPLMHLYAGADKEEKYLVNFTIFPRPPKFFQRESGKIIAVTAASIVIAFIYPITYWTLAYIQGLELEILKDKYNEIHAKRVTREATILSKKKELQKVTELLKYEQQEFLSKKMTLKKIKHVKNDYIMKAKELTKLTKDLNRFDVKVKNIAYGENNTSRTFTFDLVASNSTKITKLIKHVTKAHQSDYKFDLKKIKYDDEAKVYFSTLKATKL